MPTCSSAPLRWTWAWIFVSTCWFSRVVTRAHSCSGWVASVGTTTTVAGHPFERFTAHALVPNFVQERLFVGHKDAPAGWLMAVSSLVSK